MPELRPRSSDHFAEDQGEPCSQGCSDEIDEEKQVSNTSGKQLCAPYTTFRAATPVSLPAIFMNADTASTSFLHPKHRRQRNHKKKKTIV